MKRNRLTQAAFSLVELVVAIGIASFSLVSIVGLLPIGLSSSRSAVAQTGAVDLMTSIVSDLRSTAPGAAVSPRYAFKTDGSGGQTFYFNRGGTSSASLQADSSYKAVVQAVWQSAANQMVYRVALTWPAQASSAGMGGSIDTIVSLPAN